MSRSGLKSTNKTERLENIDLKTEEMTNENPFSSKLHWETP